MTVTLLCNDTTSSVAAARSASAGKSSSPLLLLHLSIPTHYATAFTSAALESQRVVLWQHRASPYSLALSQLAQFGRRLHFPRS